MEKNAIHRGNKYRGNALAQAQSDRSSVEAVARSGMDRMRNGHPVLRQRGKMIHRVFFP